MDSDVAETWEALGAAYERIGRLTAALRAYERAAEVDGSRVYALAQVRPLSPARPCAAASAPHHMSAQAGACGLAAATPPRAVSPSVSI